jgi:hypothetical protein
MKKIISDMKSKLNADTFRRLKSIFHLYFIQINFENGDKNGVFGPFLRGVASNVKTKIKKKQRFQTSKRIYIQFEFHI